MLETAIKGLTGDAGNQSLAMSGKILSSLGQAYAFKGETEEAEKWFKAALEKWGDDSGNANITLSYLLHLYVEAGTAMHLPIILYTASLYRRWYERRVRSSGWRVFWILCKCG